MAITIIRGNAIRKGREAAACCKPIEQTNSIDTDPRASQECQTATVIGFFHKYLAFIFNRATYIGEKRAETFSFRVE